MKFDKFLKNGAAAAAIVVAFAAPADAAVLGLNTGWNTFGFDTATWDTNYTFTLAHSAYLLVTDAFLSGDMFEVFNNAISIGQTSAVAAGGGFQIGSDYDGAFASADFSSAYWVLGAGTYDISGTVVQSATGTTGGGAAIQLTTAAVPVPAALPLLGFALAGLGVAARRRRKA